LWCQANPPARTGIKEVTHATPDTFASIFEKPTTLVLIRRDVATASGHSPRAVAPRGYRSRPRRDIDARSNADDKVATRLVSVSGSHLAVGLGSVRGEVLVGDLRGRRLRVPVD